MVRILLELFGLRQKGSYEEAYELIDMTLKQFIGLNSKMVNDFDEQSLIDFLKPSGRLNYEKCFVAGILLKEEGELLLKQNMNLQAKERFKKSLALLENVRNTSYAELLPQMESIFRDLERKLALDENDFKH